MTGETSSVASKVRLEIRCVSLTRLDFFSSYLFYVFSLGCDILKCMCAHVCVSVCV